MPTKAHIEAEQDAMKRERVLRDRLEQRCVCEEPLLMTYMKQKWCRRCSGWRGA